LVRLQLLLLAVVLIILLLPLLILLLLLLLLLLLQLMRIEWDRFSLGWPINHTGGDAAVTVAGNPLPVQLSISK
jgi:hypothetical protein